MTRMRFSACLSFSISLLLMACTPAPNGASSGTSGTSAQSRTASETSPEITQQWQSRLLEALETQSPSMVTEHAVLKQITTDHVAQLAQNPQDIDFQVKQIPQVYQPVAPDALSILLQREHLISSDNIVTISLSDGDPEQLLQRFESELGKALGTMPFSHYGITLQKHGPSWFMSCVLVTEVIQLAQPVAMQYDAPLTVPLKGDITLQGFANPRVLVTQPDGAVVEPLEKVNGLAFDTTLNLAQTGIYSIEVEVDGPFGRQPACNFMVAVGVPFPEPEPVSDTTTPLGDLSTARQQLLDLINADRAAQNVPQLALSDKLNTVSQAHSQDMVDNQFVGHNSPTLGTPQEQAFAFQLSDNVAQNVAVNTQLAQAHHKLMSSPGHRQTLLSPEYTHVGLGIVQADNGQLYITENFTEQKLIVDPLPATIGRNTDFEITGQAVEKGIIGVFVDQKQQSVTPVEAGERFTLPLRLSQPGKQRIFIGFSGSDQATQLKVYNLWDITVQ